MARVQEKPHWSVGKRLFDEAQAWDPWACEAGVWGTLSFIALASGPASTLPRLTPPLRPGPSHLSALLSSPLPPHVRCRKRDSILGVWSTEWPLQWGGTSKWGPATEGTRTRVKGVSQGSCSIALETAPGEQWYRARPREEGLEAAGPRLQVAPEKGLGGVWSHVVTSRAGS